MDRVILHSDINSCYASESGCISLSLRESPLRFAARRKCATA